jgi:hypothetical protein
MNQPDFADAVCPTCGRDEYGEPFRDPAPLADTSERKDGLFLTQDEWEDLAATCRLYLEDWPTGRRHRLAERIVEAAQYDGPSDVISAEDEQSA